MLATLDTLAERARENRGQTAAEYMGVLLVVSVIIAAVATTDIGETIKTEAVRLVKQDRRLRQLRRRRGRHLDNAPVGHGSIGTRTARASRVLRVRGTFGPCQLGSWDPGGAREAGVDSLGCPASVPAFRALVVRARSQRGQTAAEYLGVLLIVSVIIADACDHRHRARRSRGSSRGWSGTSPATSNLPAVMPRSEPVRARAARRCALAAPRPAPRPPTRATAR